MIGQWLPATYESVRVIRATFTLAGFRCKGLIRRGFQLAARMHEALPQGWGRPRPRILHMEISKQAEDEPSPPLSCIRAVQLAASTRLVLPSPTSAQKWAVCVRSVSMRPVPPEIWATFERRLHEARVSASQRPDYRKWVRFYLDFCQKYGHSAASPASRGSLLAADGVPPLRKRTRCARRNRPRWSEAPA
jgi:hypothetical protein